MGLADGIRKHGFRRWHERELLLSHGWLAVALVCGVIAFAAVEAAIKDIPVLQQATLLVVALGSGAVTLWALQRFFAGLLRAQHGSSQATCAHCGTFGRIAVTDEGRDADWLKVSCRECGHQWVIEERTP